MSPAVCTEVADTRFGPGIRCEQFDFTLTFQQSIFGIGISSFFLLWLPFKLWQLRGANIKAWPNAIYVSKIVIASAIAGLQAARLALWTKHPITHVSIAANVLELVGALVIVGLAIYEYPRTARSSKLTTTYIGAVFVADCVLIRTLYIRGYAPNIAAIVSATAGCKLVLLLLENLPRRKYLKPTKIPFGPVDVANPFSRAFLWWLNHLLVVGYGNILELQDLYPLDQDLYSERLRLRMEKSWNKYKDREGNWPMVFAGIACLKWNFIVTFAPRAGMIAISYAQTFLITDAINYLETPAVKRDVRKAYGMIGAAGLIYTGTALCSANYMYKVFRMITSFRGATASLIYGKALIADAHHNQMAAVTLMSTDVDRIALSLVQLCELWAQFTQIGIGIWLLWRQLGATAIAPTLMALLCFVGQMALAKRMGPSQADWVKAVGRRIGVTSSILRSMKSVKLAGLASSMGELIQAERVRELKKALRFRWILVLTNGVSTLPTLASSLVVFAAFSIEAKIKGTPPLTTAQAFTSLSILSLLTGPAMQLLMSLPQVAAATGCIKRVQDYLLAKGFEDKRASTHGSRHSESSNEKDTGFPKGKGELSISSGESSEYALSVSKLIVAPAEAAKNVENPISFDAKRGSVTMIIGPVGSGKSTLLKAILGEIEPQQGTVDISTPYVGYCSQSPWLQNRTIRENIVGAGEFDREWYRSIIRTCALEEDLSQMPQKDLTLIGSRGITLSGGQKHRVALARALYSRCSVLVLDDFLSSIDRRTQRIICQNLFAKGQGHVARHGVALLVATHITTYVHLVDNLIVLDAKGSAAYSGGPKKWIAADDDIANGQDYELPPDEKLLKPESFEGDAVNQVLKEVQVVDTSDTIKRQQGDMGVWVYYGKSMGLIPILILFFCIAVNVFGNNFQKLWLQWNTGVNQPPLGKFLGIYGMFVVVTFVFSLLMFGQIFLYMGPKSARKLHQVLVTATVKAPMSFFEAVDSSVLLNRFSQDMTLIDFALPISAFMVLLQLATCIMNIALIAVGSSYMAATVPLAIFALYWVQRFYLRTSRQLRLLDLETKTPLYQHFTETLEGVATIRAFGWQRNFDETAFLKLNDSQRPYFQLYCIQRWLSLVLGLLVAAIAVILITLALLIPKASSGGALGVALNSILSFNMSLTMLISGWTEAETSLGSVARTESFQKFTPVEEDPEHPLEPDSEWPRGAVDVSDMAFTYADGTTALTNVSFSIAAGQKFGIVGRTGSGKSTLLSSFLRLIDPSEGKIVVDGIDIGQVSRETIRDRLICLPQDALVFPGTFKFNLDPDVRVSDEDSMVGVLESVGLWTLVDGRGGLSADLKPESLSHGEQQLLALARALLRKQVHQGKCILVLDEATSNLDSVTEGIVQKVIDQEFKDNTVITVAHRLDTIKDYDMVLMLDRGEVVKLGTPKEVWGLMGVKENEAAAELEADTIELIKKKSG